jgi:uncharacterized membrane protein
VESKAKIMGHPIHPILIPFPLGLLTTSIVFDVVHLLTGSGKWSEISFWMIAAGVIGGLAPGLMRWQKARTRMSDGVASSEMTGSRRTTSSS